MEQQEYAERVLYFSNAKRPGDELRKAINDSHDYKNAKELQLYENVLLGFITSKVSRITRQECANLVSDLYKDQDFKPQRYEILLQALKDNGFPEAEILLGGKIQKWNSTTASAPAGASTTATGGTGTPSSTIPGLGSTG